MEQQSMQYFTLGQVAKKSGVSVSSVKRWLRDETIKLETRRNNLGWRLFTELDLLVVQNHVKKNRKSIHF